MNTREHKHILHKVETYKNEEEELSRFSSSTTKVGRP
jgi:hypothetical protein